MPNLQDLVAQTMTNKQEQERQFQTWYAMHASRLGLDPNPDNPLHFYDWRSAYQAGAVPDVRGHWPSIFKRAGHPNLVVGGIDTRTGQPVGSQPKSENAWQQLMNARPFDTSAP